MEEAARFKMIFESLFDGVIIINQKGMIENINSAASKIFGFDPAELIGQSFKTLLPDEQTNKEIDFLKNSTIAPPQELVGRKKNGNIFAFLLKVSETQVKNETIFILVINDITDRKIEEGNFKRYVSEIEQNNLVLQDLAYASAHDLQEPLRKIKAFGDRLKVTGFENLPEEGKDSIEKMLAATIRMQTLIDGLLSFTRITSNAKFFTSINLSAVLKEVLSDLEITIDKTNTVININSELPSIEANATQIRQLFQNLITNAIKFKKEDMSPVINIHYKYTHQSDMPYLKGDKYIELYFEDNGIGFNEKYQDKIFNIFQRLEGPQYEGSGMGLAICRKIVVVHRGEISAKSQPGKGATFMVKLPVKQFNN
jgi:two-component system, LuxR family, sensor kinase FixL